MNKELFAKLVSFKTTADNPEEIKKGFEYIAGLFDENVFEAKILEKNGKYSLLVSFAGKDGLRPHILLNGHFDVVPAEDESQFVLRVEGDKAFGRGTMDMKGMACVLIEMMLELGKFPDKKDVALLLNGDEEVGGENGAGYIARELGMRPEFMLCADGSGEKSFSIVTKGKGVLWLELQARGKTAHGAYPWLGENALDMVVSAIRKIQEYVGEIKADAWKTTVNVGVIETGNKTPNKVPADARAVLDIRFTGEFAKTPDELLQAIQKLVPGVETRALEKGSPLLVREDNSILAKFRESAEAVLGKKVPYSFEHGAVDARYFAGAGVPVAVFGAVGANMHAQGEWVDIKTLEQNKEILRKFLAGV
ncbi:MAG: M20/M25/M40 family metallo-hydrolase [Candidatus Wildermuthbacteria bacterium]|nr:M20/M25/M40 family metallo-hydrolase [Candidatus Wildermuthbacteria bacterium]